MNGNLILAFNFASAHTLSLTVVIFRVLSDWLGFSINSSNVLSNSSCACATRRVSGGSSFTRRYTSILQSLKSRMARHKFLSLIDNKHDLPRVMVISSPSLLVSLTLPSHTSKSTSPGNRKHTHTGQSYVIWSVSVITTRYAIVSNKKMLFVMVKMYQKIKFWVGKFDLALCN